MKQYKIFEHPQGTTEVVKEGWSWPAFFFGAIWALVKQMYGLGAGVLVAFFLASVMSGAIGGEAEEALDALIGLAAMVLAVVFGINGNEWRVQNLQARGFAYKETMQAASADGAVALYVKQKAA